MENCVKFPKSTPLKIVELYGKLDFQRRKLERQRIDVQERLLKKEEKRIVMNDNHKRKEVIMRIQQIDTAKEGVHYSGQRQRDIIEEDGKKERLMDCLMNSFESSTQHTDVLTEEEETVQQIELLTKENKEQQPCVFNFNKCFVSVGFVANARGDLAQVSHLKMKEGDFVEEFNPWSRDVKLLERVMNSHDSVQEGKDDREATSKQKVEANKAKVSIRDNIKASKVEVSKETKAKNEVIKENQQQIEELVDSNNLKQKEGGRNMKQNMDHSKDLLEIEIEEMWQLMMKQFKWRKMVAEGSKINQSFNLIDKKKKMEQKTIKVQQQQGNKACGQFQNKAWDPGRQRPEDT